MGEAFDNACSQLHDRGQPAIVYEVIAKRIIDAAEAGETHLDVSATLVIALASGQYRGEFTRAAYGGAEVDQALWIWTIAVF